MKCDYRHFCEEGALKHSKVITRLPCTSCYIDTAAEDNSRIMLYCIMRVACACLGKITMHPKLRRLQAELTGTDGLIDSAGQFQAGKPLCVCVCVCKCVRVCVCVCVYGRFGSHKLISNQAHLVIACSFSWCCLLIQLCYIDSNTIKKTREKNYTCGQKLANMRINQYFEATVVIIWAESS